MMSKLSKYFGMTPMGIVYSLVMITLGCFVYAIGINSFILPNKFGNGGVAGIAILVYYLKGISTGTTNFIVNFILLALGWRFIEKKTLIFTVYALAMMSWMMDLVQTPAFISTNLLISAIAGGTIIGIGLGLIVKGNGTTAGTDIIALMLKKYFGINFSVGVFLCNMLIVLASSFVIGVENTIVTIIMKLISSEMIDLFTEGLNRRKAIMIVSDYHDEIAHEIAEKIDRGITVLKGYGYFSHSDKDILYVIVNRNQVVRIQRLISDVDTNAFVTITEVQQVIGQGFTFYNPTNRNKKFYY